MFLGISPFPLFSQTAARYDHVDMGMKLEILPPGMQYGSDSWCCTKIFPIRTQLQYCFGCSLKQQCIQGALVTEKNRIQLSWNGKDNMEIGDIQKMLPLLLDPLLFCNRLTFRTVTIPAGIVGDPRMTAVVTGVYVCAQNCRPAVNNTLCGFPLNKAQMVALQIWSHMGGENILKLSAHYFQCGRQG